MRNHVGPHFRKESLRMFVFRSATALLLLLCAQPLVNGQSEDSTVTFHASADLVVVDVTVKDAHNKPVHGLTASDFALFEDGRAQTIKHFEAHSTAPLAPLAPLPKLPPGTFTNRTAVPATGALNVLILDKLNTPMQDQAYLHDQLKTYLKTVQPGTRMAIFGLTTQLRLLQGFTSDPARLLALLDGKKGLPAASVLLNQAVTGDGPGSENYLSDQLSEVLGNSPDEQQMLASLQQFEAEQQSFCLQLRARYTLDAFNQFARFLSQLPGRKNLLWFSGSFPISILPDGELLHPFAVVADAEDEFRQTVDLLERGQVAVYPIDARGLMVSPLLSASNSGSKYARDPSAYAKDSMKFFTQLTGEHSTMRQMADATGGEAYVDTNGLKEAAQSAIESGANYYTLTYSPTNKDWRGQFRKIQVKVAKPAVTLAYRRGYYADDMRNISHQHQPAASSAKDALPVYDPLRVAMLHGSPDPTEIIFEASAQPVGTNEESTVAEGNQLVSKNKGPFRRYKVHYSLSPHDIHCEAGSDKIHHCQIEFLTFVYDADGQLANLQVNELRVSLDDNRYAMILGGYFAYNQQISIPAKGDFYLRIGICDKMNGKIGTLEFPVAALAKLPPAPLR